MKHILFLMMALAIMGCQVFDDVEKEIRAQVSEPVVDPIEPVEPLVPQVYNVGFYGKVFLSAESLTLYSHGAYVPLPDEGNYNVSIYAGNGVVLYSRSITPLTIDENDRYFPIVIQIVHSPVNIILRTDNGDEGNPVTLTYSAVVDGWIIDYNEEEAE